ncbi:Rrf2 family transcriptional regulator [Saccharibacillus sp. CPCC 101409]|uniref:Rrf2 family transcriptional regulator n=1 Tax=Saccharibacillus sp. CPCC 101409 TaxID=3058041 RepID=UPI002671359F|nr:Rrf2 family transcriptional regulator [Saccharibacillus sp. CPCC 101409]MDO3413100.1 Rrf2 family transcriptional regulator [Saccharibacillus sp. CPCC 101409]
MNISTKFPVAVHTLILLSVSEPGTATSEFIASSVNTNPVVIRRITGMLGRAGLVEARAGVAGSRLRRPLEDITLLDVYKAVNAVGEGELFAVHDSPNPNCEVGRNIQAAMNPIFIEAQRAMERVLENTTVAAVAGDVSQLEGLGGLEALAAICPPAPAGTSEAPGRE